jgi:hypothetical protein
MTPGDLLEWLARRALRQGLHRASMPWLVLGALSMAGVRLGRRRPQVVYREELPVGSTLRISLLPREAGGPGSDTTGLGGGPSPARQPD